MPMADPAAISRAINPGGGGNCPGPSFKACNTECVQSLPYGAAWIVCGATSTTSGTAPKPLLQVRKGHWRVILALPPEQCNPCITLRQCRRLVSRCHAQPQAFGLAGDMPAKFGHPLISFRNDLIEAFRSNWGISPLASESSETGSLVRACAPRGSSNGSMTVRVTLCHHLVHDLSPPASCLSPGDNLSG